MSVLRGLLPRTLVLVVVSPSLCRGCGGVGVEKGTVEPVSDAGWWQGRAACSSSSALQAAVSLSGDGHGPRGWWSNTRAQRLESPALIAVVVMRRGRMSSRCWAEGYGDSWRRGLGARRRRDWLSEAREWQGLASQSVVFPSMRCGMDALGVGLATGDTVGNDWRWTQCFFFH